MSGSGNKGRKKGIGGRRWSGLPSFHSNMACDFIWIRIWRWIFLSNWDRPLIWSMSPGLIWPGWWKISFLWPSFLSQKRSLALIGLGYYSSRLYFVRHRREIYKLWESADKRRRFRSNFCCLAQWAIQTRIIGIHFACFPLYYIHSIPRSKGSGINQ